MPDLPEGTQDDTGTAAPTGTSRFFTQEELNAAIEAARKQEKDKLYPTISKNDERTQAMEAELKELRRFQKAQEKAEADRLAAIEKARKDAEEAEMSAKDLIQRQREEMAAQLQAMQAEQASQLALMAKEVEFQKNSAYVQRRINEEADSIAPELLQFISGETVEEIEASIERVKQTTASIVENMRNAGVRQRAAMPGVAPSAGTNGVTPLDQQGERQLTDEDIKKMGMAEYAQLRQRIGMGGANNQGLFRT